MKAWNGHENVEMNTYTPHVPHYFVYEDSAEMKEVCEGKNAVIVAKSEECGLSFVQ